MKLEKVYNHQFYNITHRVSGKAGDHEDVMLVKLLLDYVFTVDPTLKKLDLSGIELTGKPSKQLQEMITAYQKHVMKQVKPKGYMDRAFGSDAHKMSQTICHLTFYCEGLVKMFNPEIGTAIELVITGLTYVTSPKPKAEAGGTAGGISVPHAH